MATIVSAATFDVTNLNFYWITQHSYASSIYYDLTYQGTRYASLVEVDWQDNNGVYVASVFAGSGIALDANKNIIAGTITGYFESAWNGSTWVPYWSITNTSISAAAVYQAFLTPSLDDDYAIVGSIQSGTDVIVTGAGNDVVAGFGGNDVIDGGAGIDIALYGGLRSQYQFVRLADGSLQVTDLRIGSPDGTDTVSNVELFNFADILFNPAVDRAPVVVTWNFAAAHGQSSVAASSLFTVTDPDGDHIIKYALWDSGSSGHWVVNGVAQASGVEIDVTAAQLMQTSYQFGAVTEQLYVRASDGLVWSSWQPFTASPYANHAPVVNAPNFAATHSQNIAASALFSAGDADGDAITRYQFWDSTTDPASGHWAVGGVAQGTNQAIDVTAAQLVGTTFQSGWGSDDLWVRASDGLAWSDWKEFHVNAPVDANPVVTVSDVTATHNQNIAASALFSASVAGGGAVTKYQFWDSTADPASGHWVVGGAAQGTNQNIDVTAAQLAGTTFQSGSGSDDLWVRAFDGATWSTWKEFHVNAPSDYAPVATVSDFAASRNQNVAASSLFVAADPDGDPITNYQLWDSTTDPASGHWVVGGVSQGTNQTIDVMAAQLAGTTFQSGSGSDDLWVRASDGTAWGAWKEFHVNAPVDHAPVVTVADFAAARNQDITATSLFSVSDADGDPITNYQLWDSTTDSASGHWVVGGVSRGTNQNIDVTAAQLAGTTFQSGSGSDDLWVRASDGTVWGAWKEFHVNAPVDHAPVVMASGFAAAHGQDITASSLFAVTDPDGDPITNYQLWDSTSDPSSGHWVVGGVSQGTNQTIDVTAAQLASTTFQSGSGSDDLWVRANDGLQWGDWKEFHVNAPVDSGPTLSVANLTASPGQNFAGSSLFSSYTDPFGSPATQYDFWDTGVGGGHFALNGTAQGTNQDNIISAAQLSQMTYQAGSGADTLWVRANDGTVWGAWSNSFTITG